MHAFRLSLMFLLTPLLLGGCILDNKTRQEAVHEYKPQIHIPPPVVKTTSLDTDKLVGDTAARVSQNVKTDMATNQAQLSGHITGQIHKIEASLSELIKIEAKMDNKLVASLKADLTSTIQLMASLKVHMESQIALTNEMKAKLGHVSGQMDATVAGQVGVGNSIEKTLETLQMDIKANSGRDTNLLPPQAVEIIKSNYHTVGLFMLAVLVAVVLISIVGYNNARKRQEDYAKLLMLALADMDPDKGGSIRTQLRSE